MQITRQADYAVRAVVFLTQLGQGKRAATNQIAREKQIPPSFLAKIVSQLSVAGILQTSRGAHGGVSLSHTPDQISLLDVIEAIDGPIMLNECAIHPGSCNLGNGCPLHPIWLEAQTELVNRLRTTTFDRFITR
jgi:Rrf2 family protein